jgi:adenylate cyclase
MKPEVSPKPPTKEQTARTRQRLSVPAEWVENEVRIVQSVQNISYMPALLFGNAYGVLSVAVITWPFPVTSKAIYPLMLMVLMLVPMLISYLKLKKRPRPESVSRRRIRQIVTYSGLMGICWAVSFAMIVPVLPQTDAIALFFLMVILIYGSVAMLPSIPRASTAYMVPILLVTLFSAYQLSFLAIGWWSVGYFGAMSGVILSMWQNWYDLKRSVRLRLESLQAQQLAEDSTHALERVSGQLAKYISPQLYEAILGGQQDTSITSRRKKLTVFFSDIAGFTELTDQLQPEELTTLLNQYLTEMVTIAREHGANFDKFIGDAIVLYFGDPDTQGVKEDATAAVRMGIAMQQRIHELQSDWREMGIEKPFEIRIGINTGYCTVGNFGSEDRMDYTIIGAEVNLASRLEYESEAGGILLAHETYSLVKDWVMVEQARTIDVRGFSQPVKTYRVKGLYQDLEADGQVIHHHDQGIDLTIDHAALDDKSKEKATEILENALKQLKD